MTRTHRTLIPLLAALSVGAAACDGEPSTPVADDAIRELEADLVMFGTTDYLTVDGIRSGLVVADSAYVFEDSSVTHLFGVDMTLYNDQGAVRAQVTAERGVLHQMSEVMVAYGNVIANVRDQGVVIETEELHYDPAGERIWSDSVSTYRRNGSVTRGTCFRSDLQFRNYTVCSPVGAIN